MLAGRILLTLILIVAGVHKISEFHFFLTYMKACSIPLPTALLPLASAFEIGVGTALGAGTRLCIVPLFADTLPLNSILHNFSTYPPEQRPAQLNLFLFQTAMLGGFLHVIAHGGGALDLTRRTLASKPRKQETVVK